ncbi:MAG TPA: LysM peptidoglycan-binding domain-containing protein, partial [Polyangiaceae bacterium]|nr:LysM peptidoglycan-binding domain-containing protein [Polyangiaceae bacterium]
MRIGVSFAALGALALTVPAAQAQGFGPDTTAAAIPADSGGSVVIAPQNNGTTTYSPANPGEGAPAGATHSVVVTNAPSGGGNTPGGSLGTNGILPDDEAPSFEAVPDVHLVRRGDTLWDLCNHFYQNPWAWPKVWSYNPQIANPHWIYPGDQVRLTNPNGSGQGAQALSRRPSSSTIGGAGSLVNRRPLVPKDTVFLRDQGFLGDPKRDVWGELVGSDEEQMMLAEGNHVVLIFRPGVTVSKGQELTIFNSIRQPQDVPGARKPPGEIVAVRGTVKVLDFNPDTRMAKGLLTESVDVIERGAKVGPIGRRFDIVPPRKTAARVVTRVLTSIYPNVYIAQHEIAFLDKGSEDGLQPGSRLFVVRKGDSWRASLTTGSNMTRARALINSPEPADAEDTPTDGDEKKFPEDSVAELRVLRTEKYSSIAIVTQSQREVVS